MSCALRVLPGETTFDRSFEPNDLGELDGGKAVTWILWADGRALFRDQRLTADRGGGGITPSTS